MTAAGELPFPVLVVALPGRQVARYLARPVPADVWQRRATEATVTALIEIAQIAAELAVVIPVLAGEVGRRVDDDHDGYPAGSSHTGGGTSGTSDPVYPVALERITDPHPREFSELLAAARRLRSQAVDVHGQAAALRRSLTPKGRAAT